jgi:hypothetical protein
MVVGSLAKNKAKEKSQASRRLGIFESYLFESGR